MPPLWRQRELIPDAGAWSHCRCCGRPLSRNRRVNFRTRLHGLCYRHLRQWLRVRVGCDSFRFVELYRSGQLAENAR